MRRLIYFDNAATSNFKPRCVRKSFIKSLKNSANPGRSSHKLSLKNAIEVFNTRQEVAKHFNCPDPNFVIFTKNCTEALNLVILGLLNSLEGLQKEKKHVICSCFEHNSILRPLHYLKEKNLIELTILLPKKNYYLSATDIEKHIQTNTFLICITHISNVIGIENDINNIGKLCKEKHILFLLDCAQSVGHKKIDMKKENINFLTFSGHKGFLTPQGIGALCINSKILPKPITYGGTGTNSVDMEQPASPPECYESGTIMTPNILSLKSGIRYIEKHFKKNNMKVANLTQYLIKRLANLKKNNILKIYSPFNVQSGVVSFNLNNLDSNEVAYQLDKNFNIAVRGGLHCAPLTHKFLSTINSGTVRISLSFKNTRFQINKLIKALIKISKTSQKV